MDNIVCGRRSISEIIQFIRCLFSKKYKYFSSLVTGNCVSNSSFKWRKIQYSQFSRTRVNIRKVSIFANFARRTNSWVPESRENYYYNSSPKKNENSRILNFVKSPKIRNLRKFKHAKINWSTVWHRARILVQLRYIVGFWLVEMAISTNQKPTIYRNLYENTALLSTQGTQWSANTVLTQR